jgi:hypothetical protein
MLALLGVREVLTLHIGVQQEVEYSGVLIGQE